MAVFAATQYWSFDLSSDYLFNSSSIEVTSGSAQLKALTSPAWYDWHWTKRQDVVIDNTANTSTLTNYQVAVTINSAAGMNADFSDIRFTDSDGVSSLSFWQETYSAASSSFWVKVPSIAGNSSKTIYAYYGNASATSASDGTATFLFFDTTFTSIAGGPAMTNAALSQTTPTYDTSGQAVHPDLVYFDAPWNGYSYWLLMEPYPAGNDDYENPSILVSDDGASWEVPVGLTNPIDPAPTNPAHDSDGELVYDPVSDQLWAYYTEVGGGTSYLKRRTSSDGVTWSDETDIFNVPDYQFVSPSIVKIGSTYMMWSVNSGSTGLSAPTTVEYRTSSDGLTWSSPSTVTISQPGYRTWHVDVSYISSKAEYWMLFVASPTANVANTMLLYAKSTDGLVWTTYPHKVLEKSVSGWDSRQVYRATSLYDSATDMFKVWYSGSTVTEWHIGYTQRDYSDFLSALTAATTTWDVNTGTWVAESGTLKGTLGTVEPSFYDAISAGTDLQNYVLEFKARNSTGANNRVVGVVRNQGVDSNLFFFDTLSKGRLIYRDTTYWAMGANGFFGTQDFTLWHKYSVAVSGASGAVRIKIAFDDISKLDRTYAASSNNSGKISLGGYNGDVYYDDVRVREYADSTPTTSLGAVVDLSFSSDAPSIRPASSLSNRSVGNFSTDETLNGGSIRYQVSQVGGSQWLWYNNGWVETTSGYAEANDANTISVNLGTLPSASGQFAFQAFLSSDGLQEVQLNQVSIEYAPTPGPLIITGGGVSFPAPSPSLTPLPTPTALSGAVSLGLFGLHEGELISFDKDVFIVNEFGYKRLFLNPAIFGFYGHLGGFSAVKHVSEVARDAFQTSALFRNCETGDSKVYALEITGEDDGVLHWLNKSSAAVLAEDPNFFLKVFCINSHEFNWYSIGREYTSP